MAVRPVAAQGVQLPQRLPCVLAQTLLEIARAATARVAEFVEEEEADIAIESELDSAVLLLDALEL